MSKYWIAVSLIDIPEELKIKYNEIGCDYFIEYMVKNHFPTLTETYNKLIQTDKTFPQIGKIEYPNIYEYDNGMEVLTIKILEFTKCFPEYTFGIYLFHDEYRSLDSFTYWKIKDETIIDKYKEVSVYFNLKVNLSVNIKYKPEKINIFNDITYVFNDDYGSEWDYQKMTLSFD